MLQFDKDNQFRILIIADIQDYRILDKNKQDHIEKLILQSNPHLVVLLGDMLFGPAVLTARRAERIIDSIVAPIDRNKIPFAFVTGNHDTDARASVPDQVDIYRKSPWCMTPKVSDRDCSDAYYLDIMDERNTAIARLLFFDSGATHLSLSGIQYDPASNEQLRFTHSHLTDNSCPPSFVFQHIPIPEIYRLVETVPAKTAGAVKGHGPFKGKYLMLKDKQNGSMNEAPCPPWKNVGQFEAWSRSGKVRAAVFGHDHKNSFEGDVEGVSLIQTSCAGLSCYGLDELRGGRLLTISSDGNFISKPLFYRSIVK